MEFYRKVKIDHDPTMRDLSAEEMDETQSYIEQMVAAASARPVPEPEVEVDDTDLEELGIGLDDEVTFDEPADDEDIEKFDVDEAELAFDEEE